MLDSQAIKCRRMLKTEVVMAMIAGFKIITFGLVLVFNLMTYVLWISTFARKFIPTLFVEFLTYLLVLILFFCRALIR